MAKNQHLLAGLVVLGVVNFLTFLALLFAERDSTRGLSRLERELTAARDEHRRAAEVTQLQLKETGTTIEQLREEVDRLQALLAMTRKSLEAAKERLDKLAPPDDKQEEGR